MLLAALAAQTMAAPLDMSTGDLETRQAKMPQFKSATYIGNVTDPNLDRDSCGSVRIGTRAFWTCRDTMVNKNGVSVLPVISSTVGWTDPQSKGGPVIKTTGNPVGVGSTGTSPILQMYGYPRTDNIVPYFPLTASECNTNVAGACPDGSRWAIWPDSPPLISQTSSNGASAVGYTWVPKAHLYGFLQTYTPQPAASLYRSTYLATTNKNTLPSVRLIAEEFWKTSEINFGRYGGVTRNGVTYMYGQANPGVGTSTCLARVTSTRVEQRASYQYYNNTAKSWSNTMPSINSTDCGLPNAGAGGQGTFYYSTYYASYVWIGQAELEPVANFYISTAPAPEGPWVKPYLLWQGQNGDAFVGAYTLQAHPSLLPSNNAAENGIYLSYTKPMATGPYTTPLVYVQFA